MLWTLAQTLFGEPFNTMNNKPQVLYFQFLLITVIPFNTKSRKWTDGLRLTNTDTTALSQLS